MKITKTSVDEDMTYYTVTGSVELAGDGWDNVTGTVAIESISVQTMDPYGTGDLTFEVGVVHGGSFVYMDTAMQQAVSKLLEMELEYTEQGMQEEGYCSFESC